jgi:hypothetical protein
MLINSILWRFGYNLWLGYFNGKAAIFYSYENNF